MFSFMDMRKTLSQRVLQILDDQNINQVDLAKVAGCTRGRVNQWINEQNPEAMMSPRYAYPISERYGYEPRWLMTGDGPELTLKALNHRAAELINNYARCDAGNPCQMPGMPRAGAARRPQMQALWLCTDSAITHC